VRCPLGMSVVGILCGDWVGRSDGCRVGCFVAKAGVGTMVDGALDDKVGRAVTEDACGAIVGSEVKGVVDGMTVVCALGVLGVDGCEDAAAEDPLSGPSDSCWAFGPVDGLDTVGSGFCCALVGTDVIGDGRVGNKVICGVGDNVVGRSDGLDNMAGSMVGDGLLTASDVA
jgi:hypothetical protein